MEVSDCISMQAVSLAEPVRLIAGDIKTYLFQKKSKNSGTGHTVYIVVTVDNDSAVLLHRLINESYSIFHAFHEKR